MGQHRTNPRAIAAAQPLPFRAVPKQPDVTYGFQLQLAIEPNAEARLRMEAEDKLSELRGEKPREWKLSDFADSEKDLVVYRCYAINRTRTPGGLELQQPLTTMIRVGEFDRHPLASIHEMENGSISRFAEQSRTNIAGA